MNGDRKPTGKGRGWSRFLSFVLITLGLLLIPASIYGQRLWTIARFAGNAHTPKVDADFAKLGRILPPRNTPLTAIHSGFAHNYSEKALFIEQVWNSPMLSIHGYPFHAEAWDSPDLSFPAAALGILTHPDAYVPYGGPKMCGGFHADFAVRFQDSRTEYWILVCLGCREVIIFHEGDELICELEAQAHQALLDSYRAAQKATAPVTR